MEYAILYAIGGLFMGLIAALSMRISTDGYSATQRRWIIATAAVLWPVFLVIAYASSFAERDA